MNRTRARARWDAGLEPPSDVVDFLIIGAQKAGTTWLRDMLRQHPEIHMPAREIHFFNKEENLDRGLGWYEDHFEEGRPDQLCGEKTPNYLWVNCPERGTDVPGSHERIARCLPHARLIAILRDPVERAISAYNHHLRRARFPPHATMAEAVLGRYRDIAERHGVLSMGRYHLQLASYLEVVDANRILVLEFEEDVKERPGDGLQKVCAFLGVDSTFEFENRTEPKNVREETALEVWARYWLPGPLTRVVEVVGDRLPKMEKRTPDPETRERLVAWYRSEVDDLRRLLDRSFETWQV